MNFLLCDEVNRLMDPWLDDVANYLLQLGETASRLEASVQTIRDLTRDGAFGALHEATIGLANEMTEAERLLEQRQRLLQRRDAPAGFRTLTAALRLLSADDDPRSSDAAALANRCEALGTQIDLVREQALALFVCQYHLADTTAHLLRLLLPGSDQSGTYGRTSATAARGGGLLDKAG